MIRSEGERKAGGKARKEEGEVGQRLRVKKEAEEDGQQQV